MELEQYKKLYHDQKDEVVVNRQAVQDISVRLEQTKDTLEYTLKRNDSFSTKLTDKTATIAKMDNVNAMHSQHVQQS